MSNSPIIPVRTSFDLKPTSPSGTITDQILANDAILCGGIASTQWRVTVMKDQQTALQPTHSFVASFTLRTRALRNFFEENEVPYAVVARRIGVAHS